MNKEQKIRNNAISKFNKTLKSGDYFGEAAIIYKCSRTATVKSKLYSTVGKLSANAFSDILNQVSLFEKYLKKQIVNHYDDDLKIFLIESLKRIKYLKNVDMHILVHIAYNLAPYSKITEKGHILYKAEEDEELQTKDEMIIIFDGSIELFTVMDAGSEFPIEVLPTGSILNPNNFLCNRKHSVNYRCLANCTLYCIKYDDFAEIAYKYNDFYKEMLKNKALAESMKNRDQNPLDYIKGNPNFFGLDDKPLN